MRNWGFDKELKVCRQFPRPPGNLGLRPARGEFGGDSSCVEAPAVVASFAEAVGDWARGVAAVSDGDWEPELLWVMGPPKGENQIIHSIADRGRT